MSVWGVVVAGGSGTRFGAPKQFLDLDGATLVERAVGAVRRSCDGVVVVITDGIDWSGIDVDAVVTGGVTRADSVRAGLAAVPDDIDIVVVHDAARPLATDTLFASVIDAVAAGADGAVPAIAVADTIKRIDGTRVAETLDRSSLVAVQTPQAFRADVLRSAHTNADDATDDAALVERGGGEVVVVAGDPRNLKVTTPDDFVMVEAFLRSSGASGEQG